MGRHLHGTGRLAARARPLTVKRGKWVGGLAEWREGETVYLSVAFTWLLGEARARIAVKGIEGKRLTYRNPHSA